MLQPRQSSSSGFQRQPSYKHLNSHKHSASKQLPIGNRYLFRVGIALATPRTAVDGSVTAPMPYRLLDRLLISTIRSMRSYNHGK